MNEKYTKSIQEKNKINLNKTCRQIIFILIGKNYVNTRLSIMEKEVRLTSPQY